MWINIRFFVFVIFFIGCRNGWVNILEINIDSRNIVFYKLFGLFVGGVSIFKKFKFW